MRPVLRKAAFGAFIVIDALLVVAVVSLVLRYAAGASAHERVIASLADNRVQYAAVNDKLQPDELTVSQTAVVGGTDGTYELVAIVTNPDPRWAVVSADYTFVLDNEAIAGGPVSFFPQEERLLANFNVPVVAADQNARPTVIFSNLRYQRVFTARDLPAVSLAVNRPVYRILSSQPGNRLSQIVATVTNEAVFQLPLVEVTAVLMNGPAIVGAGRLELTNLKALEERPVDLRLFQNLTVTNVLVHATVDLSTLME